MYVAAILDGSENVPTLGKSMLAPDHGEAVQLGIALVALKYDLYQQPAQARPDENQIRSQLETDGVFYEENCPPENPWSVCIGLLEEGQEERDDDEELDEGEVLDRGYF